MSQHTVYRIFVRRGHSKTQTHIAECSAWVDAYKVFELYRQEAPAKIVSVNPFGEHKLEACSGDWR